MNICLINPPYTLQERYGKKISKKIRYALPPLGLLYVAAVAEKTGHKVTIIDAQAGDITANETINKIKDTDSDIIGFFTVTPTIYTVLEMAKKLKQIKPDTKIILGGPHASGFPEKLIRENKQIDIIVIGEAEMTFPELCKKLGKNENLNDVDGICYRENKGITLTKQRESIKDLDSIPFPARHLIPIKKRYTPLPFHYKHLPVVHMIASRGCNYGKCTFCFEAGRLGPRCRRRSPQNVIDEIKFLIDEYGAKEIAFWDDNFVTNHKWVEDLCNLMVEEKLSILWSCSARCNFVNEKILRIMRKAGCWSIFYGVESGNQDLLDRIKKGTTLKQIEEIIQITKKTGIEVRASFMLALPGETPEKAEKTIRFALKLRPDYSQFCITTPFAGTEMYEDAKKSGRLLEDLSLYSGNKVVFIPNGYKDAKQIIRIQKKAYRRFYINPRFLLNRLRAIKSFDDIKRYWNGLRLFSGIVRSD